jgi:hypothetical protein
MRLPSRFLVLSASSLLCAAGAVAQAPPPAPTPRISGGAAVVTEAPGTVSTLPATAPASAESAPSPMGYESDLYCFGYLGAVSESFPVRVTGAEEIAEQEDFLTGDLLYVDAGADKGLKPGDEFWIITPEQEVFHPVTGRSLGRFYQYRGRAVVHSIEGRTSSVRVSSACTDIPIGSVLKRFEPIPIPLARKTPPSISGDPPSGKVKGRIVFSRDGVIALGEDNTVLVDLGEADGLQPGDFLTIYRYSVGRDYGIRPVGAYWFNLPPPPDLEVPRTYLGELSVLAVGDRWAVGRITDSFRLVEVGDEVELK